MSKENEATRLGGKEAGELTKKFQSKVTSELAKIHKKAPLGGENVTINI